MAKKDTVSVWCMRGGKITEVKGCRLGKEMVTLPDGQRWSRKRGSTEGFYDSEMEAAQAFSKMLPSTLEFYRTRLAAYESLDADCKRVFEEQRRDMHAISAKLHGSTAIADAIWGGANGEPQVIDGQRDAAPGVGNG